MRYIMISALFLLYAIKSYTCTFTLSLYDSFGDGWNGSTLTVQVNGVNVLTNITLSTGLGPATFTFTANDGDIITTIFYGSGLWESECNYTIINNLGLPNFADGMNNTVPTGGTFAADCGPPPPPPTYDDPCTAQPLTVGATCNYIAYTTQWATGSPVPNPSCSWSYMGGDVWFSAIVPASGRLTVDIAALGMLEGELAIYFGPNCNTLTELHCVATSWIDPIPEIFVYTSDGLAGQTVWIRIWEPNNDNPGIFNICAYETPPPPANDDPCTAQPLTVNATCTYSTYTTYQATPSAVANPSCSWSYMGGDVWFTAVVPASGRLTVDIAALAMTEGEIAVYYGPDCSNLTELHCITSAWNNPMPSIEIQTIDGLAGQTVWIRVWEVNNDNPGDFNICAFETPPPPANTDPCNAINLTVGPSCVFTTYSNQYGELSSVPLPSCEWNVLLGDLWFTATVPNSGRLQVQTGPIDVTQGGMAIYNAPDCNSITAANEVACNPDGWTMPQALIQSGAGLAGQTVWIRFWWTTNSTVEGNFNICAFEPPPMIEVDTNLYTPEEIIENVLVTGCLEASNVTYCGDNTAVGYFTTGQISGFETGIIMGSGPVDAISGVDEGDNIDYDCITEPGIYNDMSSISASNGGSTSIYDMNVIEFDFVPSSDTTIFKFVFASEEYDAYECTAYNDVFAFFVSGPGISGPYSDNAINVALVPGTSTPITISTINNDPSCCVGCNTYYTDVVPSEQLWVQGMTLPIEAVMAGLTPCETYHIKFVVCDAGDGVLNTFVFFQGSSFTSGGDITMNHHSATGVDDQVYEGCQNYFVYSRVDTTTLADSAEVLISISGTVNVNTDLDTILPTQFWLPPGIMSDTIPYTAISDGIAEGTEYLIISLINGCPCNQTTTIVDTIFIFDNFDLQAAIGGDTLICLSQSATISTTVNPAFNPGDISYLWSTAATTNSITVTPNTTTTYFVTIQDPCSQTAILSHTVTVIPTVVAAFTVIPDSVCTNENTTITFTGTAGPSAIYTWNFDGGTVASGSGQGPYQVYWTTAGQPTITLNMNDNGCMGYGEEDITVSQIPTSPFTVVPTIICSGDTLTINYNGNASPAAFYLWDFDGGAVISGSGQGPIQVNWTLPGNHDITLEVKENGCTSLETVITVFNPAPLNIVPSTSNIDCPGNAGQASFDVSGGVSPYIYNWSPNPPPLQMGDYTVTITDQLGCYDTYSFSITSPNPFVYVPAFTNLNCYNDNSGSITTSLTGGSEPYTYKWSHDNLNQFTQDSAVTGLSAGTYYLTITDDSLCTVKDTFYISQPALLVTSITSSTNISCFGDNNGSATAVASGGTAQYTFQWNDPLNQATPQAVNLPAGNYSVTTTDAHSCTATASVTLTQPTLFTSTITGTDVSCYGGSDGTITVSPTGGTTPYFHEWSPQQPNNFNIDGLSAGVYWVTISDAHSCTTLNNYIINEPDSITYIMTSTPVTCFGYNNGTAVITITGGGTPNFTFSWSNGQMFNHPFLSKILAAAGTYTITITDAAGCTLSTSVQITQPAKVMVTVPPTQYMCTNGSKSIYASATGGHPGYTYTWSTNQTTSMITVAPAHTTLYNVFATDILNCTSELAYVKVVVYPPLSFDVTVSSDTICPGEDVTFAAHTVGGESPYIYTLSPGITVPPTFIMHPIATTTYSLTVSDVCETPDETDEVTIYVMVEPSNDFYPSITSGCTPLTVQFNETNDMDNRTFDWDFGDPGGLNHDTQQNPFHIYQNPGDYSVSLTTTSEFGCISLNVMNNLIHVYPSPDAWFTNTPDVADILDPTIHFTNQSTLAYVSNWIFGDGSDTVTAVNPVHQFRAPGEYYPKLIVETEHQCKDSVIGTLIIINDKYTFFAPTAFSPDEDGTNDLFSPKIHGLQQGSYHLYIYDRWGEIIFDTDRYDVDPESGRINYGWDGKAKAGRKAVKPGVYTWFLIYKDLSDIEHVESGSVTVIR